MIKTAILYCLAPIALLAIHACCPPTTVSSGNCGFPASVTETYTKTSLVSPPSYATPYLPPSSIYQTAPVAAPMPVQAPLCPPPMPVQAPVCHPPQLMYRADPCPPQYQSYATPICPPTYQNYHLNQNEPCLNYAGNNIRYNVIGTAQPHTNPQYIVVQPQPHSQSVQVPGPKLNSDDHN
jgi:hypothetical protein